MEEIDIPRCFGQKEISNYLQSNSCSYNFKIKVKITSYVMWIYIKNNIFEIFVPLVTPSFDPLKIFVSYTGVPIYSGHFLLLSCKKALLQKLTFNILQKVIFWIFSRFFANATWYKMVLSITKKYWASFGDILLYISYTVIFRQKDSIISFFITSHTKLSHQKILLYRIYGKKLFHF